MAESTLSAQYSTLQEFLGHYLGYGTASTAWTAAQTSEVDRWIQAGYRQFLYPPQLPDPTTGAMQARHTWSFLKPTTTITTTAATDTQDLPDDFGGMDGDLTFTNDTTSRNSVRVTGEAVIRARRQSVVTTSAPPELAAVRPKPGTGLAGQRYEILWYPTPDAAYDLLYRYNALQAILSPSRPWPLGGMVHSQTLIESCLSKAESHANDMQGGPHEQEFLKHLAASIAHDRSIRQPEFFGYCGNREEYAERGDYFSRFSGVTYTPTP